MKTSPVTMHFLFRVLPVLGLMALVLPSVSHASVFDFSDGPEVIIDPSKTDGAKCEIVQAPGATGGLAMRLSWKAHEGKYISGLLLRPSAPIIEQPGVYQLTVRVYLEQLGAECTRLALRLSDRSGEMHQFTTNITPGEPGWTDVTWTVDTRGPDGVSSSSATWGGDKNGVLDLPVRFRGIALPFNKWKTSGGEIWLDKLDVTPVK